MHALKNALDWTVSSGELVGKPMALITAATGDEKAHASFLLTLSALSAKFADDSTLLVSFIRSKIDVNGEITNLEILQSLQSVLNSLISTINNH